MSPSVQRHHLTFKEGLELIGAGGKLLLWIGGAVWMIAVFYTQMNTFGTQVTQLARDVKNLQMDYATMCGSIKGCKMIRREGQPDGK